MFKIRNLISSVIIWRLALIIFTIPLGNLLNIWSNFDGLRFLAIAKEGYGTPHTYYSYSLFPLYPKLIATFSFLGGSLSAALIITHLCLFLATFIFVKLASLDLKAKHVKLALFLIPIFPASFFLGAVYSESLFLLPSLLTFYFARKNNFLLAVFFAAFASYTRSFGLLLWPALIVEYFHQEKFSYQAIFKPRFLLLLIPPLGALSYLRYISVNTSHLFNFLPSVPDKLILLHQVFFRYLRMSIFINHTSPLFFVVLTEFAVGSLFLLLLIFSFKHLRPSYWLYFLLTYLVPTLWGNFVGMPRFMVVVFPAFLFLAPWLEKQHPFVRFSYYVISLVLLFINLSLFARGYFVG